MSKKSIGKYGEFLACIYYERAEFFIIYRNVRTKSGEIDIIALKKGSIYFIEVKTRSNSKFGYPEEAISEEKKERIKRCVSEFLEDNKVYEDYEVYYHVCAIRKENERLFIKIYTDL
jgi:putative endonuclease